MEYMNYFYCVKIMILYIVYDMVLISFLNRKMATLLNSLTSWRNLKSLVLNWNKKNLRSSKENLSESNTNHGQWLIFQHGLDDLFKFVHILMTYCCMCAEKMYLKMLMFLHLVCKWINVIAL